VKAPQPLGQLAAQIAGTIFASSSTMGRVRVLVIYGPKGGGREGLARRLVDALTREGIRSEACAADEVDDLEQYDAVAVGGARAAGKWQPFARWFARRHASALRNLPAWFLPGRDAATGRFDEQQVGAWARTIAAALVDHAHDQVMPSPTMRHARLYRSSRLRHAVYTFLGGMRHGVRSVSVRRARRSIRWKRTR
jgi:hypothetical protein